MTRLRAVAGFTLIDAAFLMMLITVVLIPMAGMFPLGHVAVQKAKDKSIALFLAKEQVNEVRAHFPSTLLNHTINPLVTTTTVTLDRVAYTVVRKLWTVETRRWIYLGTSTRECDIVDVEITVSWLNGHPFVYATRLGQDTADMQMK